MEEALMRALIGQVREKLVEQNNFPAGITPDHVVRRAGHFFDDINDAMRELRIYCHAHPDVIVLCQDLATYFLKCGDIYFAENENDTSTADRMLGLANRSLLGVKHDMENKFEDTYQRNHWHGW